MCTCDCFLSENSNSGAAEVGSWNSTLTMLHMDQRIFMLVREIGKINTLNLAHVIHRLILAHFLASGKESICNKKSAWVSGLDDSWSLGFFGHTVQRFSTLWHWLILSASKTVVCRSTCCARCAGPPFYLFFLDPDAIATLDISVRDGRNHKFDRQMILLYQY